MEFDIESFAAEVTAALQYKSPRSHYSQPAKHANEYESAAVEGGSEKVALVDASEEDTIHPPSKRRRLDSNREAPIADEVPVSNEDVGNRDLTRQATRHKETPASEEEVISHVESNVEPDLESDDDSGEDNMLLLHPGAL